MKAVTEGEERKCRYRLRWTRGNGPRCALAFGALAPRPLRGRRLAERQGDGNRRSGIADTAQGAELAAHLSGERLDRQQEVAACRMPGGAVLGDSATADQAMDVRVQVELLIPGMQHRQHGEGAADEARITGELDDRAGCRFALTSALLPLGREP
jgi:hypothetical protein